MNMTLKAALSRQYYRVGQSLHMIMMQKTILFHSRTKMVLKHVLNTAVWEKSSVAFSLTTVL